MSPDDLEWITPIHLPWAQEKLPFVAAGISGVLFVALFFVIVPAPPPLELVLLAATPVIAYLMYKIAPIRLGLQDDGLVILRRSSNQVIPRRSISGIRFTRRLGFCRLEVSYRTGKKLVLGIPGEMASQTTESRLQQWLASST